MRGGARFGRIVAAVGLVALLGGVTLASGSRERSSAAPVEAQVARELAQTGHASFFVVLEEKASLAGASAMHNRSLRGEAVYDRLTSTASTSQAPIRALLDSRGIEYRPYWIVNAIFVRSADSDTVEALAARPDAKEIRANHSYPVPKTQKAKHPATTEWGINAINAPQVWSTYDDRGEGIVVASIDTGVRYSHQALVGHYRGNLG